MSQVDREQVFSEANGGTLTKSAYYLIYVSKSALQNLKAINVNFYEPNLDALEKAHPYGRMVNPNILREI